MNTWRLTPLGPVVARDGRPFGTDSGNRMRLTPWLYPSMAAGSFRTMAGKNEPEGFTKEVVGRLKKIQVAGPFPYADDQLYLPKPNDIVRKESGEWLRVRPVECAADEGTDLPHGLVPATIPPSEEEDFKPGETPPWWSAKQMAEWLMDKDPGSPGADRKRWRKQGFMDAPEIDRRTHVAMEDDLGAGEDGLLFQTSGYEFDESVKLAVRVSNVNAMRERAA